MLETESLELALFLLNECQKREKREPHKTYLTQLIAEIRDEMPYVPSDRTARLKPEENFPSRQMRLND